MVLKEGGDMLFSSVLVDGKLANEAVAEFLAFVDETAPPVIIADSGDTN